MPERRIVHVNPITLHREMQGDGVLLQLETGKYFGLDAVAERAWELIVEHGDLELVEQALLREYEVDPSVLSNDLSRLVAELVEHKLIETGPAGRKQQE